MADVGVDANADGGQPGERADADGGEFGDDLWNVGIHVRSAGTRRRRRTRGCAGVWVRTPRRSGWFPMVAASASGWFCRVGASPCRRASCGHRFAPTTVRGVSTMGVGFRSWQLVGVSLALLAITLVDGCGAKHPRAEDGDALAASTGTRLSRACDHADQDTSH